MENTPTALHLLSQYLHCKHPDDKLKVFKLLFRIEEFYLCEYKQQFFKEDFQKWECGPVIAELWHDWQLIDQTVKAKVDAYRERLSPAVRAWHLQDFLRGWQLDEHAMLLSVAQECSVQLFRENIRKILGEPILTFVHLVEEVFKLETGFKMSEETHHEGSAWHVIHRSDPSSNNAIIPKEVIMAKGSTDPYFIRFKKLLAERKATQENDRKAWLSKQERPWAGKAVDSTNDATAFLLTAPQVFQKDIQLICITLQVDGVLQFPIRTIRMNGTQACKIEYHSI